MPIDDVDPPRNSEHRYRPEIDGLRAIAVVAVVMFHAGFGFPGGFTGVDVFFVISGYLVTGIIARAMDRGDFSILNFYCRRVRRIFPAAAVVTAVILLFAYRSTFAADYVQISKAAVAQSGFSSNVFFWLETGYFSRDVLTKPFLHFWSLAVEEQFYLVFPGVLMVVYRVGQTRRRVVQGVIAIAVVSFVISIYGTQRHPSATFYLLPTRAWELMAGALVALTKLKIEKPGRAESFSWIGLAMIALALFGLSKDSEFPGFAALLPVVGTVLVIVATSAVPTVVGRLLSLRPIVFVGLISYSLYLWHWPLLAFTRYLVLRPSSTMIASAVVASFALAVVSWRWVEQPVRRRQLLGTDRSLIIGCAVAWAALLIGPLFVVFNDGIPGRFDVMQATLIDDATWTGNNASRDVEQIERGDVPRFGQTRAGDSDKAFLLWGDSHAMTWTDVIDRAASRTGRHGVAALHGGTPPIPGLWRTGMPGCREFNHAVMELIEREQIRDVILVSRWSVYVEGYSDADPQTDGRSDADVLLSDGDASSRTGGDSLDAMKRQIVALAEAMRQRNVRLWLVRQVPIQHSVIAEAAARNMLIGRDVNAIVPTTLAEHIQQQSSIEEFYEIAIPILKSAGGGVIDPASLFFDQQGNAVIRSDGNYLYRDDDHLSRSGASMLGPLLDELLGDQADSAN